MIFECCECKNKYEETDDFQSFLGSEGCPMICYACAADQFKKRYQPERSKRENLIDNADGTETCICGCGSTYLKDAVL